MDEAQRDPCSWKGWLEGVTPPEGGCKARAAAGWLPTGTSPVPPVPQPLGCSSNSRCSRRLADCSSILTALPRPGFRCVLGGTGHSVREGGRPRCRRRGGKRRLGVWVHEFLQAQATFLLGLCCVLAPGTWVRGAFPGSDAQGGCSVVLPSLSWGVPAPR